MQKALDVANQRRSQAEASLNTMLESPLATIAGPSEPNEELEDLRSQLKITQLQLQAVCRMQIDKEQEMMQQLQALQEQLSRASQGLPALEEAPREPPPFQDLPSGDNQQDEEEEDHQQGQQDYMRS